MDVICRICQKEGLTDEGLINGKLKVECKNCNTVFYLSKPEFNLWFTAWLEWKARIIELRYFLNKNQN